MPSVHAMPSPTNLVVTGATGKQGGALISALVSHSSSPFRIHAVTRNVSSPSAIALSRKPNVRVIQGDFDSADAIFRQVENPWGLFSMTNQMAGAKLEEQQGKAMTKAAIDAGVQHIVFTATDRGGQRESDTNPTDVPHFKSKYNIEQDILHKAEKGSFTWTFLRPVAFFENLSPDFFGKGFVAMWRLNGMDRKLQLISTRDIGKIAAEAFIDADKDEYRNQAISLAGDEVSPREAERLFKSTIGQDLPSTYSVVGRLLKWFVGDLRHMFHWFLATDFHVDISSIRTRYPFMHDFSSWLKEESSWKA